MSTTTTRPLTMTADKPETTMTELHATLMAFRHASRRENEPTTVLGDRLSGVWYDVRFALWTKAVPFWICKYNCVERQA